MEVEVTVGEQAARPLPLGGRWITTGADFAVIAPYSGEIVGRVSQAGAAEASDAVEAAADAMAEPLPPWRRAELLEETARLIAERQESFAQSICREAGKPIRNARLEADRAAGTYRLAAAQARSFAGAAVPLGATPTGVAHIGFTLRVPIGVVGAITPFNFPLNLVAHKLAPALAAGCAVVLKPDEKTPLTALLLAEVLEDAGLPGGWVNIVCGRPVEIGDVLARDERVKMISFTGSERVGWELARRAARKRVALELGNISPAIVAADADLELAATKVATHAFAFAGQTCVSVQRVYVHDSVAERFLELLKHRVDALRVGDPADEQTDVGPLIDDASTERVAGWIEEALAGGAAVVTGARRENGLLRPTVLSGVPATARLNCDEAFGPVCVTATYRDIHDAFDLANATGFGLQAAIFTSSIEIALQAAEALDFGGVMVNEASEWRADEMPYGGVKASGNTREGPASAVMEMTIERLVVLSI
jgi:acyl-CoA reductase-like NAD-dependent aldehyde dehydrogenase